MVIVGEVMATNQLLDGEGGLIPDLLTKNNLPITVHENLICLIMAQGNYQIFLPFSVHRRLNFTFLVFGVLLFSITIYRKLSDLEPLCSYDSAMFD